MGNRKRASFKIHANITKEKIGVASSNARIHCKIFFETQEANKAEIEGCSLVLADFYVTYTLNTFSSLFYQIKDIVFSTTFPSV